MKFHVQLTIIVSLVLATWTAANAAQSLTSFTDATGDHVLFIGDDSYLHQVSCYGGCSSPSNWTDQALALVWPPAPMNTALASFVDRAGEHVFFQDGWGYINHLFWNGPKWSQQNLLVKGSGSLTGYGNVDFLGKSLSRLYYTAGDSHIHLLTSSDSTNWSDSDLAVPGGDHLISFSDSSGEHMFYQGRNSHICQLYGHWASIRNIHQFIWTSQDLAGAQPSTPLSGFSDSLGEHVMSITSTPVCT